MYFFSLKKCFLANFAMQYTRSNRYYSHIFFQLVWLVYVLHLKMLKDFASTHDDHEFDFIYTTTTIRPPLRISNDVE